MAKTANDSKPKKPLQNIWGFVALGLSVITIAGLLSYDIWGEKWLEITGRSNNSSQPHQHEEISNITSQNVNTQSRLQALERIAEALQNKQQQDNDSQNQFLSTLESLQTSLAQQNNVAKDQQEALQTLQGNVESVQQQIRQNPQTLSVVISMISERRKAGLPLQEIPKLLQQAGFNVADDLQAFESVAIPTDEELLQAYEALRPEIALALGGVVELPTHRNFIDGLKAYLKSLVRIRKLGERQNDPTDFENLNHAIEARNFSATYQFAKNIDSDSDDIAEWVNLLQLRQQADDAVFALHDILLKNILSQAGNTGQEQ